MRTLLISLGLLIAGNALAQQPATRELPQTVKDRILDMGAHRSTVVCGPDTALYLNTKTASPENKLIFSDGTYSSRAGQFYPASSSRPVTVFGFKWFGYSVDLTGASNVIVDVDCSIYAAGSDSLPTGSPIQTVTITVDTVSANAEREIIFNSPATMNGNYVLVIENSSSDYLYFAGNDEDNNEGAGEQLSLSFYEPLNAWRKNDGLWALGDYDHLFYPIVSHGLDATFTNPASGCLGIPVTFTNTTSGYMNNRFYSMPAALGNPFSYHWDYGDGNTDAFLFNGNNTYTSTGNYSVTLRDTLYGWTSSCPDFMTISFDVFDIPPAPSATPPVPVCEGTPADLITATGTGGTFNWYNDIGLTSLAGSGNPYSPGFTEEDTLWVTETVNACESPGTEVIVTFLPNPQPIFTATPTGGLDSDFTTAQIATGYSWDFGDGSPADINQNTSHTFFSAGPHTVCLTASYANGCSREYCETVSFVGIDGPTDLEAQVYPNPFRNQFTIRFNQPSDVTLELVDLTGKRVFSETLQGTFIHQVSTWGLPSGTYVLRILYGNVMRTIRLVHH